MREDVRRWRRTVCKWHWRMRDPSHFISVKSMERLVNVIGRRENNLYSRQRQYLGMFMLNYWSKWNRMKKQNDRRELQNMHNNWQWVQECHLEWRCTNDRNQGNLNHRNMQQLKLFIKLNQFQISINCIQHSRINWIERNCRCVQQNHNHLIFNSLIKVLIDHISIRVMRNFKKLIQLKKQERRWVSNQYDNLQLLRSGKVIVSF